MLSGGWINVNDNNHKIFRYVFALKYQNISKIVTLIILFLFDRLWKSEFPIFFVFMEILKKKQVEKFRLNQMERYVLCCVFWHYGLVLCVYFDKEIYFILRNKQIFSGFKNCFNWKMFFYYIDQTASLVWLLCDKLLSTGK